MWGVVRYCIVFFDISVCAYCVFMVKIMSAVHTMRCQRPCPPRPGPLQCAKSVFVLFFPGLLSLLTFRGSFQLGLCVLRASWSPSRPSPTRSLSSTFSLHPCYGLRQQPLVHDRGQQNRSNQHGGRGGSVHNSRTEFSADCACDGSPSMQSIKSIASQRPETLPCFNIIPTAKSPPCWHRTRTQRRQRCVIPLRNSRCPSFACRFMIRLAMLALPLSFRAVWAVRKFMRYAFLYMVSHSHAGAAVIQAVATCACRHTSDTQRCHL